MYSKDGTFVNCCHRHTEPRFCNCGGNYGREAPSENSSEAILMRLVRTAELETVRTTPRKLPERLPFPIKPGEPDWGKNRLGVLREPGCEQSNLGTFGTTNAKQVLIIGIS